MTPIKNVCGLIAGAMIALSIIYVVEHITPHLPDDPKPEAVIINLEYFAISIVFGVLLLHEAIHLLIGLVDAINGKKLHVALPWEGIILLFLCISTSGGIYVAFARLLAGGH
jgi:hypothetical protein